MSKTIKVLVNTGNPETSKTIHAVQGKPTTIKAVAGARYQLQDPDANNAGPQKITSKRLGKNLHIMFDGSTSADVIVEGYYDEGMFTENNRGLYGSAEDGKLYEYIPEDPTREGMPVNLADGGRPFSQVLGGGQVGQEFALNGGVLAAVGGAGVGLSGAGAAAGGGFGLAGAGAIAAGAAALGGGGGGAATPPSPAQTALAKIEAYNNGDGTNPAAPSLQDYATAGITGVTADNLAAVNAQVLAQSAGGADTAPEVQALVTTANNALAKIEDYNNGNGTTPAALTVQDYANAGITGVNAGNVAAVNAQVLAQSTGGADTAPEVQALLTAANNALAKIENYNNGDGATPAALTAQDYADAGVTGVTSGNLSSVNATVLAQNTGGADTTPEVQALVNGISDALAKIEAYNKGNGITPVALTAQDYANAGITGVTADNLAAVNANVLAQNVGGADTAPEGQALVTTANNALAKIETYNNGDGTTPAALTAQDYADAGITGVTNANLAAVNAQVLAQSTGGADTVPEVQALVNGISDALAKIEAYNNGNGTAPVALTVQDYADAGITGVTSDNLAAVNANVLAQNALGADTIPEVQALVTAANNALAKIEDYNNGDGTTPVALTEQDYANAGITGVSNANLAAVNAQVLAQNTGGADTVPEVQALVNGISDALAKIEAYNKGDGTTPAALSAQDFANAGITGVTASNLAAVNAQVLSQTTGGADTQAEVQALVTAANVALDKIEAYNNGNGTSPVALTVDDYAAAGIVGVTSANLAAVNAQVLAASTGDADTVAEIQTLVSAAENTLVKIEAYNNGDGTTPAALTVQDYAAAGITGVTADNLAAVNAQVLKQTTGGTDTTPEVQALVTSANDALAKIEAYNNGSGTTPAALTLQDYADAGITGINADNLAVVNAKVLAQSVGGADTVPEVQALVNDINFALVKIEAYNNGNGITPVALTAQDYANAGITGVTADNLAAVNANVLAQSTGGADTLPEVQALVTAANNALAKIEDYNNGNGTTPAALTAQDYANAGITGVTTANLAAVNTQVLAQSTGGADTAPEVQALVNGISDALAKIEAYNNGNGIAPVALTVQDYADAGITGVTADNLAAVNANVLAQNALGADTIPEVQALVTAANNALAKIEDYNNGDGTTPVALTEQDYANAGITGVSNANLAAVNAQVLAQNTGVADTVPEVQALVNGISDALAKIEAYNKGDGTTPAALSAQDFANAGITGVTASNLAAVNAVVLSQAVGGADTIPEVQALVTTANNALAKIEDYNNGDGATPAALTAQDYVNAGITGVNADNLAAVNAQVLAQSTGGADTVAEVQALVTAANNALAKIEAYNNGNGATPAALTLQDYADAGITGVTVDNLPAVNAQVLKQNALGADTSPEVQALVTAANNALAKIEDYNNGNGTTPAALTEQDYVDAGITGVTSGNLAAVNANILGQSTGAANTAPEVQALVDTAAAMAAALETIAAAAEADNATSGNLAASVFVTAGVTGVDGTNLSAIQSALDSTPVNGLAADTTAEVQTIVDAYNAIKANADTAATANATQAQYAAVGVTGVDSAFKTSLLGDVVDAKAFADVDTVGELQTLADLAAVVINGAGTGTAPTKAQLEALGITGVTDANLSAIQAAIAATADDGTGVDTLSELQTVANTGATNAANAAAAAAALSAIAAAAQANNATDANVAASVFATAGVTGVDANNVAAIQSALNDTDVQSAQADTVAKVQAVVDAYNAIKANADTAATTNATQAQYAAIGVNGIDNAAKTSLLGDVVDTKAFADVDTVGELQTLANLAAVVINAAGTGTAPTKAQLEALGITGVTDANLSAIQAAIAATADDGTGVDTLSELQAVANTGATNAANAAAAAAALSAIAAAAQANNATDANVASSVFATAGVTGVDANNVAAIQSALNDTDVQSAQADTVAKVQAVVDAYNAIKANADSAATANATQAQYAAIGVNGIDNAAKINLLGDVVDTKAFADVDSVGELQTLADAAAAVVTGAAAGTAPTKAQLEALGITGVTDVNLASVQAAIAATADDGTGVDTLGELQTVVTNAANAAAAAAALSAIAAAAQANDATDANVAASVFATAGVTGVDSTNIAAIQSALNDTDVQSAQADTVAKVQAVVDAYNAIKANADSAATANATQAQYAAIGVNGIDNAAKTSLLGDVVDTKAFADVDTVGELQTLATAAAAVITGAAAGAAPTKAQLEALGITGVTDANLSAIQAAIATTADDGTGVDTLSELQTVVTNAANAAAATALSAIAAAAQANDASNTNVAASVFATAGVNGVDANNVAAIQSALNDADVQSAQADTAAKVQAVVDAYNAIKANADTAATANATQAQYAAIGVNGIDNAAKTSLLGDVVDTKAFADVDTVGELQTMANLAAVIINAAGTGTAPTKAQLEALGITGVTDAKLSAIQAAIAATADNGTGVDTLSELQTVVTNAPVPDPVFGSTSATAVVAENTPASTVVHDATADADVGMTYSLVAGADAALFSIDAQTGEVRFTASPDFESPLDVGANNVYNFTVRATNFAGGTADQAVAITVTDGVDIGQATVDLGTSYGTLTLPNQIDGRTYYYWNVPSSNGGWDLGYNNFVEGLFNQDINGNVKPAGIEGPTDIYRYATINGVRLALPTAGIQTDENGYVQAGSLINAGTAVNSGATYNSKYSDLLAVWDAYNGTETDTSNAATAHPSTANNVRYYWTATPVSVTGTPNGQHVMLDFLTGDAVSSADSLEFNVMVEVLSTQAGLTMPIITLANGNGKLINPVEVEGKWYYSWDRNGNGVLTGYNYDPDYFSAGELNTMFTKDIFGNTNTVGADMNEVFRYTTLQDANGVAVWMAVPTYGGIVNASGYANVVDWQNQQANVGADTSVNAYGTNNTLYDDFAAIFDAGGVPPLGWTNTYYKTSSVYMVNGVVSTDKHLGYLNGDFYSIMDLNTNSGVFALEMVKPNLAPVLADTALSFGTASSSSLPVGAVGVLVSALMGGVTDGDASASKGMAIIDIKYGGTLCYSTNGGSTWLMSKDVTAQKALLLGSDADNRIFFQPGKGMTGTVNDAITFRAWDRSRGEEGQSLGNNATVNGGASPFSAATETLSVNVATSPIVLDLNRDGSLSYSHVAMDVNGDGHLDNTAWSGRQDGVLVWDKYGNGVVRDASQYAFTQYGGQTDLQGLAAGFDSNRDGVLDAKDAKFAQFKVWQDANQNGVSDAGEVRSLGDLDIASINLTSDGVVRNPVEGVTEVGQSSAVLADGSHMLVSDAAFAYSALAYSTETMAGLGAHIDLLGSNMHLDLSSIVAVHSDVTAVDLTGTGANSLKLTLADVLGTAITHGVHTLKLTGDANDTVVLSTNEWANTGTSVTEGDHTYAVYSANASAAAQLLIDQHMLLANHA